MKEEKKFNEEERYQLACAMVTPYLEKMFVTPTDIDEAVKRISYTISEAMNMLFAGKEKIMQS